MDLKTNNTLPVIKLVNFEDVKKNILEITSKYKGLVVTESTLKSCAKDQKELAHIRIEIDSERKRIKKIMQQPIIEFETKCKELTGLVIEAEGPIKEGLEVFETKRKDEKMEFIVKTKDDMVGEAGLPEKYADRIEIHERWLNKTVEMKEWEAGLRTQIQTQIDKAIQEKRNKETFGSHIETMNDTLKLKSPMKPADFEGYHHNDFENIEGLINVVSRAANKLKEAEQIAVKEIIKETPEIQAEVQPMVSTRDPVQENEVDWHEVCNLMAQELSGYLELTVSETLNVYVQQYKEGRF